MQWLRDYINDFWQSLYGLFLWLVQSFFDLLVWLLKGLAEIVGWVLYTVFDGLLVAIHGMFSVIDLSAVAFNNALGWSSLPSALVWFIGQIGLSQCFAMVAGTFSIRLLLNLIPGAFTRV